MSAVTSFGIGFRWIFSLCLAATSFATADDNDDGRLLARENLGGIKVGLGEQQLAAILGKSAVKRDKPKLEAATGEYIQTWICADKGLSIRMSSGERPTGPKKVAGFTAKAKCPLATSKGIKIGSAKTDVHRAYGAFEEKESRDSIKSRTFVAGSIYGGIIFSFGRDGKVNEIFFGAAAE